MVAEKTRKKIIDAFIAQAAELPWEEVSMPSVAERASVKLATLRSAYDSRIALLEDFFRRIDTQVLEALDEGMADEPAQDRLFDILMNRLDALAPHKDALRAITREAWRNPLLAAELNRLALRSSAWMLSGAGIDGSGLRGLARTQGLVVAFGRVVRVWLDDEDQGQARTMAALDRELNRGAAMLGRLDKVGSVIGRLGGFASAAKSRVRRTRDRGMSSDESQSTEPA